ncbi:YrhC family protein (plasmid) [Bacillus sp. 31A1R]|uniref:YrhC family protein n=1 Tax=Robertmurraya mangrovi TaxID=3098077 RepID=A0ABU5IUQ8_9BACI|nr:YrhC family protein [Bacillus sp. 31A1R]MDZ5470897.1 YrhC family protein [Bacillus sp. 31A1R]
MKKTAKQLHEKMVDFKRFAIVLLAAGVFFYLGVIIPTETKTVMDTNIMIIASTLFLIASMLLFVESKKARQKLMEMDEGEEYLMKK